MLPLAQTEPAAPAPSGSDPASHPVLGGFGEFVKPEFLWKLSGAGIIILVGLIAIPLVARFTGKILKKRLTPQGAMVMKKLIYYVGFLFVLVLALNQLGLKLGAVLGAAGVAGIAIGFAAQTSLSNIISGFFLIGERPFELGDVIEVDGVSGNVDAIGLLSLTLRTFDNRSVRIPNESLVKNKVINVTRHPIRRYNLDVGVSFDEDIAKVLGILKEVAYQNEFCLDEPAPFIVFTGFGDSSLNFMIGAWCLQNDYTPLRNSLPRNIKERFDAEDVEIPFPHLTIASGKASAELFPPRPAP